MAAKRKSNPAQRMKAKRGKPLRPGRKYNAQGKVVKDPNRARVKKRTAQARKKTGPYSVKPRPKSTTQPSVTPHRITAPTGRVTPIKRKKTGSRTGGSRAPSVQRHGHG